MAISFLLPSVHAIEFTISLPDSVNQMEEFEVQIDSEAEETHDVKIFFKQDSETLPSEIQTADGWKNAYYYVKSSFPAQKVYTVRLKESNDEAIELCARLRKTGQTSFSELCKAMEVEEGEINVEEMEESENSNEEESEEEQKEEKEDNPIVIQQVQNKIIQPVESDIQQKEEPIILRNKEKVEVRTSQGKTQLIINYVLALVALIALFLVVRKQNREF